MKDKLYEIVKKVFKGCAFEYYSDRNEIKPYDTLFYISPKIGTVIIISTNIECPDLLTITVRGFDYRSDISESTSKEIWYGVLPNTKNGDGYDYGLLTSILENWMNFAGPDLFI